MNASASFQCRGTPPRGNILYLIDGLGMGGAERLLVSYARQIENRGFAVRVAVLKCKDGNPMAAKLEERGIPVDFIRVDRIVQPFQAANLWSYIARHRPDLIHTQLEQANIFGTLAARTLGIPAVATLHTLDSHEPTSRAYWRDKLCNWVMRNSASRIFCVSDSARHFHIEHSGLIPEKLVTLYNGIELPGFENRRNAGLRIRQELAIPETARLLVTLAVLRPDKGIQNFLRAFPKILEGVPEAHYLVVGDGPHRGTLEDISRNLGLDDRVVFTGRRDDVGQVLSAADLFVHPTLKDALPTVLAEAMACGLPLIASNVGGVPEMAFHGRNALLVTPGDPDALAEACLKILRDPALAERLRKSGQEIVRELFDIEKQADKLAAFYDDLIASAARA